MYIWSYVEFMKIILTLIPTPPIPAFSIHEQRRKLLANFENTSFGLF